MGTLITIIVLVVGIGFLVFFIVNSTVVPKRVDQIAGFLQRGKTQVVIKAAKAMLAKDPKNADVRYFLGKAYLLEKKEDLAFTELKALSQSGAVGDYIPEENFRQEVGQLYIKNRQVGEALKEYILLIKKCPGKAEYYYWAGKLFLERNQVDMAQNYLRKAAELAPRDAKVQFELGVMLYKSKNIVEAKDALERSLKYQADNAQAYFYLGKIQKDAKDYPGAIATLEKAARDPAYRLRALVERGGCYMTLNAIDKAIPDLERAVKSITEENAQESIFARYFLAMCYEKNRDMLKAVEQWDKIHTHKPGFKDVETKLNQYQDLQNDDAIKDFLSAGNQEFMELCKNVVGSVLGMTVKSAQAVQDGVELIATEDPNTRKPPWLVRIYRSPNMVEDSKVRSILDDAKRQNMGRAMLMTSAGFTRPALDYAESRPVELFGKDKLQSLLKKAISSK
ncbi:MAG: tetratricopeptide repeat protein [Spirochaetaceae bacterium]|jgi:tetratricopeptide (TPR) repeat protein|nr:tetratricopeptide repeat protein [Spirochaetaceae bacterium]